MSDTDALKEWAKKLVGADVTLEGTHVLEAGEVLLFIKYVTSDLYTFPRWLILGPRNMKARMWVTYSPYLALAICNFQQ